MVQSGFDKVVFRSTGEFSTDAPQQSTCQRMDTTVGLLEGQTNGSIAPAILLEKFVRRWILTVFEVAKAGSTTAWAGW